MIAVSLLRSRVAPVLNWCSRVLIVERCDGGGTELLELAVESSGPHELLRILRKRGIKTLLCGALTPDLMDYGAGLGIEIIYGLAGEVGDVLQAYGAGELEQPCFRLPGCQGPRCGAGLKPGKPTGDNSNGMCCCPAKNHGEKRGPGNRGPGTRCGKCGRPRDCLI